MKGHGSAFQINSLNQTPNSAYHQRTPQFYCNMGWQLLIVLGQGWMTHPSTGWRQDTQGCCPTWWPATQSTMAGRVNSPVWRPSLLLFTSVVRLGEVAVAHFPIFCWMPKRSCRLCFLWRASTLPVLPCIFDWFILPLQDNRVQPHSI